MLWLWLTTVTSGETHLKNTQHYLVFMTSMTSFMSDSQDQMWSQEYVPFATLDQSKTAAFLLRGAIVWECHTRWYTNLQEQRADSVTLIQNLPISTKCITSLRKIPTILEWVEAHWSANCYPLTMHHSDHYCAVAYVAERLRLLLVQLNKSIIVGIENVSYLIVLTSWVWSSKVVENKTMPYEVVTMAQNFS